MWSSLWNRIKEAIIKMLSGRSIEKTLQVVPIISNKMVNALTLWDAMYRDEAPWVKEPSAADPTRVASLGLPSMIASEKARMAILEMKSEITVPKEEVEEENPDYIPPTTEDKDIKKLGRGAERILVEKAKGPEDRAKWLNEAYQKKVIDKLRPQVEYGIAKGGLIIKPYMVQAQTINDKGQVEEKPDIEIEFIQADAFYPLAFDGSGKITEAAFVQTKVDKEYTYRRLEHHKLQGTVVSVKNRAFKAKNNNIQNQMNTTAESDLGQEIPLKEVPEWADLKPEAKIENVDRLLFAYFKMPEANTIDPLSPLGVSGYSRAVNLIKQADLQYSRMLWEFEATEAAIDIDRDALMDVSDRTGAYKYVNPTLQARLFRPVDLGESNTYEPFLPTIRDESIINGLNNILMRIEDTCSLSRGTLSDVSAEARTATELKILKQRSYQANADIQKALQTALEDVVYIMNVYASLYEIVKEGEYEASFEWDDSILVDVEAELSKRMTLLQNGLTSKLEVRMWYFGETESQAQAALQKVTDESRESMEEDLMAERAFGESREQKNDEIG